MLKKLCLSALMALSLTGCSTFMESREITANRIAYPAFMLERQIPAGKFNLMAWERVNKKGQPAHIYIEGDGLSWISTSEPSLDPTPINPVALWTSIQMLFIWHDHANIAAMKSGIMHYLNIMVKDSAPDNTGRMSAIQKMSLSL